MGGNAVCNWDFTLWDKEKKLEIDDIINCIKKLSKKYSFQLEDAGSGLHYQGRISLKIKKRESEFSIMGGHLTRTSKENMNNDFYVTKEETRVDGPWRDTDMYVPKQIREITELWPWQKTVIHKCSFWEPRIVNIIIDKEGCTGKSTLVGKMCCELKIARKIPPLNNYKEIMCMVMNMPESKTYLIDQPRALDKTKQEEFYSAVESIKDGHVWDNRYTYKEKWFDSPNIWVFSNVLPNRKLLSKDRWNFWEINDEGDLRALRCNSKP